jgi:two-component SAPR family response regulator
LEALEYLNTHSVDFIFLVLNIPKLKGFEFLKTLPFPPKVIVTNASSAFAIEGYKLHVPDYLLKPFSLQRFLKAVNKVIGSNIIKNNSILEGNDSSTKRIFLRQNKLMYK